jgi:beta-propeller repeat-containing protein
LPLSFEANQGQADERVKFLSHGQGYTLFLRSSEALFGLRHSQAGNESAEVEGIGIKLQGANPQAEIVGVDELAGHVNYFIGNDASHWIKNVSTYAKARYQQIYPGIDLLLYGNEQQLESDFVIAPGSDPNQIRLQFKGGRGLRVSSEGDLILKTSNGELRLLRPHVYQDIEGSRRDVSGNYVPHGARTVSFSIGAYDHAAPLVIDPILVYSTALNGANFAVGNGGGHGIAVDASGNAYVTGYTDRSNFLPTPGAFTTANGLLFVTKINPAGTGVLYTTVFGGTGSDVSMAITLDTQDEPVIAGFTSSADFPTMNPIQTTLPAGTHAFVTKLNAAGSGVLYSTLLGGSGASGVGNAADVANAVTTDANGAVYVTGYTNSVDFPTKNGVQPTCPDLQLNGYCNVHGFVAKLDPTQSGTAAIVYSTYLGGNFPTAGQGIAVDASGNAYVTGTTNATDFATTPGSFQTTLVGGSDAFVSVLNPGGSNFVYSTFLGYGQGWGIAVDGQGNAYVTGATNAFGGSFPVTAGAFQTTLSESTTSDHAFVTKLNPSGTGLVYSTFLGGSGTENINTGNIAIDANGNAYISGLTSSTDFPTTANAISDIRRTAIRRLCYGAERQWKQPDLFDLSRRSDGRSSVRTRAGRHWCRLRHGHNKLGEFSDNAWSFRANREHRHRERFCRKDRSAAYEHNCERICKSLCIWSTGQLYGHGRLGSAFSAHSDRDSHLQRSGNDSRDGDSQFGNGHFQHGVFSRGDP